MVLGRASGLTGLETKTQVGSLMPQSFTLTASCQLQVLGPSFPRLWGLLPPSLTLGALEVVVLGW